MVQFAPPAMTVTTAPTPAPAAQQSYGAGTAALGLLGEPEGRDTAAGRGQELQPAPCQDQEDGDMKMIAGEAPLCSPAHVS